MTQGDAHLVLHVPPILDRLPSVHLALDLWNELVQPSFS